MELYYTIAKRKLYDIQTILNFGGYRLYGKYRDDHRRDGRS